MKNRIDLHTHSTFSDGSMTPTELVAEARRVGLGAIALTDHDTAEGIPEFLRAAEEMQIDALPGVEVSLDLKGKTVHMLGYGIDPGYEPLAEALRRLVGGRHDRNERIIRKLQLLGVGITFEDVKKHAGEEVVGRPHIANALIEKGAVKNFDEAFEKYLARGAAAYCERFRLSPEEAIGLIAQSGGVSVLAHPYLIRINDDALEALVKKLKDVGLAGIEAYYTEHTEEQTRNYLDLARRHDLLVTGGTDFHGAIKPDILLGSGRGGLAVPYKVFENLSHALNGHG